MAATYRIKREGLENLTSRRRFFRLCAGRADKVAVTLRVTGRCLPHAEREAYLASTFGGEPALEGVLAWLELRLQRAELCQAERRVRHSVAVQPGTPRGSRASLHGLRV